MMGQIKIEDNFETSQNFDTHVNSTEGQTEATTLRMGQSTTEDKFIPFQNERTGLGKLISLHNSSMKSLRSSRFLKSERKLESTMQEVAFIRKDSQKTIARNESCRANITIHKINTSENSIEREAEGKRTKYIVNESQLKNYQDHLSSGTKTMLRNSSGSIKSEKEEDQTFRPLDN